MHRFQRSTLLALALALSSAGCHAFKGAFDTQLYPLVEQAPIGVQRVVNGDTMRFVDSAAYELYAPSSESARSAIVPLDRVVRDWRRYFGNAPRFAVVVFDSAAQLRAFDEAPFRARGLRVVRVLRGRPPRQQTQGRASSNDPSGTNPGGRSGDQGRFDPAQFTGARGMQDRVTRVLMESYTEKLRAPASQTSRGFLPPWFREGAISLVAERTAATPGQVGVFSRGRDGGRTMPLAELFAVSDSALGIPRGDTLAAMRGVPLPVEDRSMDDRGSRDSRDGRGMDRRTPSMRVAAEGRSLLEFFIAREGPDFLAILAETLVRGQSVSDVLQQAHRLPHDVPALEIQYRRWLAEEEEARRR